MAFWTKWSKSVPNGAKEDACRTGSVWKFHEKTNCHGEHLDLGELTARSRLCILITVDSQWVHQEVTVSSRWAPDFFSWVIMKMISYRIKGFVTDNAELKTFFKLKCMFLNLIFFFIYGVVIAYQLCFQYFIFSFKKICKWIWFYATMSVPPTQWHKLDVTWRLSLWHDNCEQKYLPVVVNTELCCFTSQNTNGSVTVCLFNTTQQSLATADIDAYGEMHLKHSTIQVWKKYYCFQ